MDEFIFPMMRHFHEAQALTDAEIAAVQETVRQRVLKLVAREVGMRTIAKVVEPTEPCHPICANLRAQGVEKLKKKWQAWVVLNYPTRGLIE